MPLKSQRIIHLLRLPLKSNDMKSSEEDQRLYQSKYYPFAPLHNERRWFNLIGRYNDSVDTLFGKYSTNGESQQFCVLDYLTLGILPLLKKWSPLKFVYELLKMLKKGMAFILALPLMLVVILFKPLLELFLDILSLVI